MSRPMKSWKLKQERANNSTVRITYPFFEVKQPFLSPKKTFLNITISQSVGGGGVLVISVPLQLSRNVYVHETLLMIKI